MPFPRRTTILTILCAGLLLPASTSAAKPAAPGERAPGRAAQKGCAGADAMPTAANQHAIREAILCLHNEIRAERGLPQLRENARLNRAAVAHSHDMVSRGFFEHTAPGGSTMVHRILRARYASRDEGWAFGENLAWGTGRLATPRGVVRAWMESPGHRANILRRAYRELGVGVVLGIPTGEREGATYTADFGVRR
jgi:uncharacterized protein YkwD